MMFPQVEYEVRVAPSLHWSEEFALWLRENGRSVNTMNAYVQDVRHFERYFSEVTAQNVKAYFAMQDVDNTVKPSSRNRRLASLRVFVRWAVEAGYMEADPTVSVKRVEVELSPRDRTADEMSALGDVAMNHVHLKCHTEGHSALGYRDELIWNLFRHTGMRISEIAGLMIEDVDLNGKVIHVLGKGGKKAPVKMGQSLVDFIASYLERMPVSVNGYLVTDWKGHGLTRGQVWRRVKLLGAAANVDNLKPHDLRHTRAYMLLDKMREQGIADAIALDGVRKELRHGDARTTQKFYLRVRDSQVRAAVEAM